VLRNCPFHRLAQEQRELICGMNLDYVEGILEGVHAGKDLTARLEPTSGTCCVRVAA
jgi:predicted ArsR family transcriptional regulator